MTDEMFTRLMDMVAAAGEGGFTLAVLYLLLPVFLNVLWATILFFVVRIVVCSVMTTTMIHRIAQHYGGDAYWYMYPTTRDRILRCALNNEDK